MRTWVRRLRAHEVTGLLLLLPLMASAGCGDGSRRLSMPPEGEVVSNFPSEASLKVEPAPEPPPEALEVVMTEPTGTIAELNAINVVFSEPMVDVDGVKAVSDAPLRITPAIEGRFRWLGTRTLSFTPSVKPPMATRFEATIPAGTRSVHGLELKEEVRFAFSTPRLRVVRHDPSWYNARLRPDDVIMVQFNLPVDLTSLREAITLRGGANGAPIGVTVTPTEKDRGNDKVRSETAFAIKPNQPLSLASSYTLQIGSSVTLKEGRLGLESPYTASFKTYGEFGVSRVSCNASDCTPSDSWNLEFTNPVDRDTIKECVTIRPAVKLGSVYGYNTRVTLRPSNAKPGQTYTVTVTARCKDTLGNGLGANVSRSIQVGHYRPRLQLNTGVNFMERPAGGEAIKYPLTLRNAPDVNLRMLRLNEDTVTPFLSSMEWWSGDDAFEKTPIKPAVDRPFAVALKKDTTKTYGLDLAEALGKDRAGAVYIDVNSPTYDQLYGYNYGSGKRYMKALVQVTDIGLTAKYSPDSVLVWTTSLASAKPLDGVQVSMRSADNTVLWRGVTNADGVAVGPGVKTFGDKKPRMVIATRGDDMSFMDLESWDMEIRPYRFGLDYQWDAPAAAVRGYVFTERGVYRPGEQVKIKGYVRLDRGRKLEPLPVQRVLVLVKDQRDQIALTQELTLSELGGFDTSLPLRPKAGLGTYSIEVNPVGLPANSGIEGKTTGSFRVEAYRAPDFEVGVTSKEEGVVVGQDFQFKVSGQYLFGAPMAGAKASWSATRSETSFNPSGYEGYAFGPNADRFWWRYDSYDSDFMTEGEGSLDGAGYLGGELKVAAHERFKGPQSLRIEATVTDVNRQVVTGRASVKVHPGEFYIGMQRKQYLVKASDPVNVDLIAVGIDEKRQVGRNIKVDLVRREWKSTRKQSAGGGSTWVTEEVDSVKGSCSVRSKRDAARCTFNLPNPGYYVLKATSKDKVGNVIQTSESLYAWGGGYFWWGRDDDERIELIADKKTYQVGDTARIMVKSPFREAQALVTVERRGVLEQKVVPIKGSAQTLEIPVTEDLMPNAYVSVVLVRGRVDNPDKDAPGVDPGKPAYKMGYASLNVDSSGQRLMVSVEAEKEIYEPGETVQARIDLKDANGQPVAGEVTFMAVDEGVLSLTGYKTPRPESVFFRHQSIAVVTAESRRAILAKVDMEDEANKGDEGGGGTFGESTNYRSAFATTAAFMPTVQVGASGATSVEFKLPDNLTAFRLMAVAVSGGNRFGSAESRVTVQKPLMLRPALPRFLSAGDRFDVRVVVQTVGGRAGKVEVEVDASGPVTLTAGERQTVDLGPDEIRELAFPARVGDPGKASFRFKAQGVAGFVGSDAVEWSIPVKYPAVTESINESGRVSSTGGSGVLWKRLNLPEDVVASVGGLDIELASSAVAELLPGLHYLVGYPYGCVEQTTGRTLPLVAMGEMIEGVPLPGIDEGQVKTFAQAGLNRLWKMQTYEGGLAYWPGGSTAHPWGSVYGGLALVTAARSGRYEVDEARLTRLKNYLRSVLREEVETPNYWNREAMAVVKPFAAYVLAVAGEPEPSYHEVMYNTRHELPHFARGLLAMAVLEAKGDDRMVQDLLNDMLVDVEDNGSEMSLPSSRDDRYWVTMDSDVRANSIALMAMSRAMPKDPRVARFARGLLKARVRGRWISTQDNAFAVLSLTDHIKTTEQEAPNYTAVIGVGDKVLMEERFEGRDLAARHVHIPMKDLVGREGDVLSLIREGTGGPLYYNIRLSYVREKAPETVYDNGFTLMREYIAVDGPNKGQVVTDVKPGQVVKVRLTVVVPEDRHYVAIEDPLPAGFEPINTAFNTTASHFKGMEGSQDDDDDDWWWYPSYGFDFIEQRDDRVLLFADSLRNGVYNHAYLARATTPGTFTVPGARVEEMYAPNTYGRTQALKVRIQ